MLPNPILIEQLLRDKQAEMQRYIRSTNETPRERRNEGLAALLVLATVVLTVLLR